MKSAVRKYLVKLSGDVVKNSRPKATAAPAIKADDLGEIATKSGCPFHRFMPTPAITYTESASSKEIPTCKGLPLIGTTLDLIRNGSMSKLHLYCDKRHKELGPIYKETLGVVEAIFVADSDLIQRVYQNEGRYPQHMVPEPWLIYNELNDNKRGLFFMDGQQWNNRRKCLNKVFLRQSSVAESADVFNKVVSDLLQRWRLNLKDGVLPNLEKELYSWSIESLGTMIFGRSMGCLSENGPKDIYQFVESVQQIFAESARMTVIPPKLAYYLRLPVWRRFVKAVGKALQIATSYVEEKISEIDSQSEIRQGEQNDGIIGDLLNGQIGKEEVVRIVTDLFLAAADTTSHATQWALYLLGKNKHCQERLYKEVLANATSGEVITPAHLANMPYVKAIVKETLRMYPVAPFLTRILSEDIVLDGYRIPAGKLLLMSLYTTGRDSRNFEDPDEFKPERWIRKDENKETISTHACLPFGLGARSCIGRRVAETQMYLLLSRAVQNFQIDLANKNEVDIDLRLITTPSEPIQLKMTNREVAT